MNSLETTIRPTLHLTLGRNTTGESDRTLSDLTPEELRSSQSIICLRQDLPQHELVWSKLDAFCSSGKIPHLLFHGASGTGKKTLVQTFIHRIYQHTPTKKAPVSLDKLRRNIMWVNCAQRKGIKFIREDLKFFAQTNVSAEVPFKIIVLHNADYLTNDAQSALRRCMEQYSQTTRFFGIVQNKRRLLFPILSRFCEIYIPSNYVEHENQTYTTTTNLHQIKIQTHFSGVSFGIDVMQTISDLVADLLVTGNAVDVVMAKVATLYDQGITSIDILEWIRTRPDSPVEWALSHTSGLCPPELRPRGLPESVRAELGVRANTERVEFRNEKLFMFHLLQQLRSWNLT
jgi:hypothetical protein